MVRFYKTLDGKPLWDFYHIEIVENTRESLKTVFFCSKLHVQKRVRLAPQFDSKLKDEQILREPALVMSAIKGYGINIFQGS